MIDSNLEITRNDVGNIVGMKLSKQYLRDMKNVSGFVNIDLTVLGCDRAKFEKEFDRQVQHMREDMFQLFEDFSKVGAK